MLRIQRYLNGAFSHPMNKNTHFHTSPLSLLLSPFCFSSEKMIPLMTTTVKSTFQMDRSAPQVLVNCTGVQRFCLIFVTGRDRHRARERVSRMRISLLSDTRATIIWHILYFLLKLMIPSPKLFQFKTHTHTNTVWSLTLGVFILLFRSEEFVNMYYS